MVISFILMYIIIPLSISLGGFFAQKKDKKRREVSKNRVRFRNVKIDLGHGGKCELFLDSPPI